MKFPQKGLRNSLYFVMHLAGFEPAMSQWEADYESDAFGHLATDAMSKILDWSWWELNPRPLKPRTGSFCWEEILI
mgnify:CR=1 FL=1